MKLIHNWRAAWRMFSVQALAAIAALQLAAASAPRGVMELPVPLMGGATYADALGWLTFAAAIVGGIGRLIDQGTADNP